MSLEARIVDSESATDRRAAPRRTIAIAAEVEGENGSAPVIVHNISAGGMLLETEADLPVGEKLIAALPEAEETEVEVVWASGALRGCKFARPLSDVVLAAASLASAVGEGLADDDGSPEDQRRREPFASRLRRLRAARGLSLARIAAELKVSKPTVWAWEQGRAKPASERLDALATVLGVERQQLVAGRDTAALDEALARARREVAEAYGVSDAQVQISIEL